MGRYKRNRIGGDLELSIEYQLNNINIAEYIEVIDTNNNLINLIFAKYINDDNDENNNK